MKSNQSGSRIITGVLGGVIIAAIVATTPFNGASMAAIVLGYLFGMLTCGAHMKRFGFWLTIAVFVALNFLHSLVDGVAFHELSSSVKYAAVFGHELIRQPMLYAIVIAMLQPFSIGGKKEWGIAVVSVTGGWLAGFVAASAFSGELAGLEPFLGAGLYFFLGDIVHHMVDQYPHGHEQR